MSDPSDDSAELPVVRWGTAETPLPDWRDSDSGDADEDPDDEELEATPEDVIAMLGFDPLEPDDDEAEDMAQDAQLAFDRSVRTYDANGHLNVSLSPISKANICEYFGHEIPDAESLGLDAQKSYRLYRDPQELAKAVHTFNRLPILSRHQPVSADTHPKHLVVGTTGSEAAFEHPYLTNSLSFWDQDAIDKIEGEDSKQLSAAYRYRADMTPGSVNGSKYDGVMRDIHGNHIALVPEGRAGADVVVGDSKPQEFNMPTARTERMSRQALFISAACSALLLPKLAVDQKMPDLTRLLKGVTHKNWKAKRPDFITALDKAVRPRLAQDGPIDALAQLLNQLEVEAPAAEVQDQDPLEPVNNQTAEPIDSTQQPPGEAKDHGGLPEQIAQKLEQWLTPEQMAELRAMAGGTEAPAEGGQPQAAAPEGNPPPNGEQPPPKKEGEDEGLLDHTTGNTDMNKPPAMDENTVRKLVANAVTAERETQRKHYRDLRDAEENIRPWIGKVAVAQDSASEYYKLALDTLGIDVTDVHPSAYWPLLQRLPKPGDQQTSRIVAMDEAQSKDFAERFPGASSLRRI